MFETINQIEFGLRMLNLRKKFNYTREKVSELSGVSIDTIRNIEKGVVIPRFETLELLSVVYKVNLIEIFFKCTQNLYLNSLYLELDTILLYNNIPELYDVKKKFNEYISENKEISNNIGIQQLNLFIDAQAILHSNNDTLNDCLTFLTKAIKLTSPDFCISVLNKDFSYIEKRILYTIGCVYVKQKQYEIAIQIFKTSLDEDELNYLSSLSNIQINLYIKKLSLISHCFHKMGDYEKSLEFAQYGIDLCNKFNISYNLHFLLFRKGISMKILDMENYLYYLRLSVFQLIISNNIKLAENYIETAKYYGLDIDINKNFFL